MPLPVNWQQALEQFVQKYQGYLVFSNDVYEHIRPTPFSIADFRSLDQRFGVLKRYLESRTAGMHTANSNEILREFFQGTIDWFSQESETNKKEFSEQLQFISPVSGEKVDFSWHGKVKSQANLRFYFAWPIPAEQNIIHIVYLGQKITKQ